MSFNDLHLSPEILRAVEKAGYTTPTPIQIEAIPRILEGKDLIASAQTGTGKTAAFLLPALSSLSKKTSKGKHPKMLILAPTRELVTQLSKECEKYSRCTPQLKQVAIFGGMPFPAQIRALSKPYDILIATPGRLLDHMQRGRIHLSSIELLVLDEADRMLDMGFVHDVTAISKACNAKRQTLLFSATMDKSVRNLSKDLQKDPIFIFIEPDLSLKDSIEQRLYFVDDISHKIRLLEHMVENFGLGKVIIFASTKRLTSQLTKNLQEKGVLVSSLHGDMSQAKRNKTFERLKKGKVQYLVATDVAARGIDVTDLTHVINFDVPRQAEDYIHRIGRTGRAGATGTAITFATYKEKPIVLRIEQITKKEIAKHTIEGMEPSKKASFNDRKKEGFRRDARGFNPNFRKRKPKNKFSRRFR